MNYLNKIEINHLIVLLPILFVTGPFLPDLIIVILSFWYLKNNFKDIYDDIKKNFFLKILLTFLIYNIFLSFFAIYPLISFSNSFPYLRFFLFACFVAYIFTKKKNLLSLFYKILFLVIIIVSLDAITQFIFGKNFIGLESQSRNRISGLFGDEYVLGSFISRMVPILIVLNLILNYSKKNLVFVCLVSFAAILVAGERVALLEMCIFYFILFYFINTLDLRKKIIISLLFLLATFFTFANNPKLKERYIDLTVHEVRSVVGFYKNNEIENKNFNDERVLHILAAIQIFKDNPFGSGNKMFRYQCFENYFVDDGRCTTHPHNIFFQILVENGFIGIFFYLTLYLISIYLFLKEKVLSKKISLLNIIIIFTPFLPSGNIFNNWYAAQLFLNLGIFLFLLKKKQNFYKRL